MEDYAREKEFLKTQEKEEKLHQSAEKSNALIQKLNDLFAEEYLLESNIESLDARLSGIEKRDNEILKHFREITTVLNLIKK